MIPYKTILKIDRDNKKAVYIQLTNQFIRLIKKGTLAPKTKLLGSRTLASQLEIHRKTVIACYEELELQGWVESVPQRGTFVTANLPLQQAENLGELQATSQQAAGFGFTTNPILDKKYNYNYPSDYMFVMDGVSDERLAPLQEIGMLYRKLATRKSTLPYLSYGPTYGNPELIKVLTSYLNDTRGLHIAKEQMLITRGSQMGMFLAAQLLIEQDNCIVVGETNYSSLEATFQYAGAQLLRISVDHDGLVVEELETLCKERKVKVVYTTPHHHHPTTVTLSAERRLHLLQLSQQYGFAIIEDDYDYDFNYDHAPILPLASHDTTGNVIYIGSFCKTIAPSFRVGYMIGPTDFIRESSRLRRFVDRQGDDLLELTFAHFIKEGDLDRHIRKVVKIYRERRDFFCGLLKEELADYFSFTIPRGGMAIWATLNALYDWDEVSKEAENQKLVFPDWKRYDAIGAKHNAIRIGFSTYTKEETKEFVSRFKNTMKVLAQKKC